MEVLEQKKKKNYFQSNTGILNFKEIEMVIIYSQKLEYTNFQKFIIIILKIHCNCTISNTMHVLVHHLNKIIESI